MKKRLLPLIGCMTLVLLAAATAGEWLWSSTRGGWTVARLEQLIGEEVPAYCDRTTVETWLERYHIEHSFFEDTTGAMHGRQTMPQIAGLDSSELSRMVRGTIDGPEAKVNSIFPGRISLYFFFDKQGRLVGNYVYPFVYAL